MNISHQSPSFYNNQNARILGKHNARSCFLPFVESHVSLVADSAVKLSQASRLHVLQTLLATTGVDKFDDFVVVVLVHQVSK
jgi:hypothetical protein